MYSGSCIASIALSYCPNAEYDKARLVVCEMIDLLVLELVDKEPLLNEEMLYLGNEISNKTLCSKISAYQVMLPKALKASHKTNINIKEDKYIKLNLTKEDTINHENNEWKINWTALYGELKKRRI